MDGQPSTTAGITIPTMNRADFVIRQLRYFASVGCQHTIYIGDSSSKEESEKIQNEIKRLGNTIRAKYFYLPSHKIWQAHYRLLTEVEEKYTCLSGDDDYQIPDSVTKCAEFLENNPGYTTASGYAVSIRLKQNRVYGELSRISDYPRRQIENNTGSERVANFFDNYFVTLFSVNRTEQTKKYWKDSEKVPDQSFGAEILPNSLSLIHGKSKILDCLGFVRQIHDRHYGLPNMFDWVTGPQWHPSYSLFEKIMSEDLAAEDNVPVEDAVKTIRHSFWSYLQRDLSKDYRINYPAEINKSTSRQIISSARSKIAKAFPVLKYLYRTQLKPMVTKKIELHYEALQPQSKYYKDFRPVMDSFTDKIN